MTVRTAYNYDIYPMEHLNDSLFLVLGNLDFHINFTVSNHTDYFLYGQVTETDVVGQMQAAWNNFVKTGQIWALLIGVVLGYMFKSLTSYS
ncbi:MAG: hypothetical protein NWQ43_15585 [Dolichospermum sp.]|uniref:hypothetical protein n=1 Tax=Anabaena sp. UHCC 0187 TaxID=2590018 RepID=UPI0020C54E7F|nr:hypothetical protein [Anabaena sp. UHCC 0187]MDP5018697.1 hypothetical protein [Dolichospermum sp.]